MPPSDPVTTAANLIPGQTYRVKTPFKDYDGILHPPGETWRFESKSFSPHDDGLTLLVDQAGQKRAIRLEWQPETQGQIIQYFGQFVDAVPPAGAPPQPTQKKTGRGMPIPQLIGIIGLGLMAVCAVLGGAAWYMLDKLSYHPSTNNLNFGAITVELKSPGVVRIGQDFAFEINIRNDGASQRTLNSIELESAYLDGVKVLGSEPPFGKLSSDRRSKPYMHFDFQQQIPAAGKLTIRFDVNALKSGDLGGNVLVCIDNATNCALYYNPLIVNP